MAVNKEVVEDLIVPGIKFIGSKFKKNGNNGLNGNGNGKVKYGGQFSLVDENIRPLNNTGRLHADPDGVVPVKNELEENWIKEEVKKAGTTRGYSKIDIEGKEGLYKAKSKGSGNYSLVSKNQDKKYRKTRTSAIESGEITYENSESLYREIKGIGKRELTLDEWDELVDYVETTQRNLANYKDRLHWEKAVTDPATGDPTDGGWWGTNTTDGHVFPPKDPRHLDVAEQRHFEPGRNYVDASGKEIKGNYAQQTDVSFDAVDNALFGIPVSRRDHMEMYFHTELRGMRSFLPDPHRAMVARKQGESWTSVFESQGLQGSRL